MNWIELTEDNVATYQAGALVKAMQSSALAENQSDALASAIGIITLKVRMAIKAGGYSVDSDASKIPAELEADALAMIVAIAKPRLMMTLKPDEVTANTNALALLYKIAEGDYAVSTPDNPESASSTTQSSGGATIVRPARGVPSRRDYNGL